MKVRDLVIVAAFALGLLTMRYSNDAYAVLRNWLYISPFCVAAESTWADVTGATRVKLEAALAEASQRSENLENELAHMGRLLEKETALAVRLQREYEHSQQVRETQSGELAHCRELIEAQEAVVRETNWRYQQLTSRLRELGQEGAVSVLVKE
jgi:hypothetical protein